MTELGRDARAILDAARRGAAPTPDQAARVWARLSDALVPLAKSSASVAALAESAGADSGVRGAAPGRQGSAARARLDARATRNWWRHVWRAELGRWGRADGPPAPTSDGHVAPAASPHAAALAPAALAVAALAGVAALLAIHAGPAPVLPAVTAPSSEVSAPAVSSAPSVDAPAPPVAPAVTSPPPVASPSRRPARRTNDGGRADVALVRSAYEALRDGDPTRALVLADEHARRFPASALAEERDATRVLALCAAGGEDARAAFERYRRDYPAGVQLRRLPAECAGGVEVPR
jgi:hypothetical protein